MGLYTKALFVILGGLLGGSAGLYFQAKEESRLTELRRLKLEEMRRLNQDSPPRGSAGTGAGGAATSSRSD